MNYAVLFGGQGYHHPGMFDIIKDFSYAKPYLEEAAEFLQLSMKEVDDLLNEDILEDKYAQPLLCTYAYAIWKSIEKSIPPPLVFTGFSLGEIAAYGCADSMDFKTLLHISFKRALYIDNTTPKNIKIIAVMGITEKFISNLCEQTDTRIMIVSAEKHFSIAGYEKDINSLINLLHEKHPTAEVRDVALKIPSHTSFLASASEQFKTELEKAELRNPKIPVLAGIDGRLVRNKNVAIRTLSAQISQTIHWYTCYKNASERGAELFLEISPGVILTKMVHRENPRFITNSTASFNTINGIISWINKYIR